jgi:hypothetical protein
LLGNTGPVGARTRQGFIVLVAVLTAVVALSSSAPAQQKTKQEPSPQELWNAYPLEPPRDGVAVQLPASDIPTPTPTPTPSRQSHDKTTTLVLFGLLIVAVFAIGVLLGTGRRAWRDRASPSAASADPQPAGPPPQAPVASRSPARAPPVPAWPAVEAPPPLPPPRGAPGRSRPKPVPIPDDAWSCSIAWRGGPGGARFRALARPPGAEGRRLQIARSVKLDWPPFLPPTPAPELVAPARALIAALIEAGWRPTDRGEMWYSQRFFWPGSEAPEPLGQIEHRAVAEHG